MNNKSKYNASTISNSQDTFEQVRAITKMARSKRTSHETKFNNWFEGRDPSRDKI